MRRISLCFFLLLLILSTQASGQERQQFIYSKEGKQVLNRFSMFNSCLRALNKNAFDSVAVGICNCQLNSIDRNFTQKQYKAFTKNNIVDLEGLIDSDPAISQRIKDCYSASGKTALLSVEMSADKSLASCVEELQKSTQKKIDTVRVRDFCGCQLELIKTKQLTDADLKALNDPNSLLFFEMMYRCGSPYVVHPEENNEWSIAVGNDVSGPASDTVSVLNMQGMSYLKIKIGSLLLVWLMDSGASDMMITKEMESALLSENILSKSNYLGTSDYEMANGMIDTCRRYKVNNVRIGKFYLNNVIVSVSDKAKRILAGRSLLNKFSSWALDNKRNVLSLVK